MQIHLARPGGDREGPFSLEQILEDLQARKYSDTDYWAWYEGLPEWMPLYRVLALLENTRTPPSIEPRIEPDTVSVPAESLHSSPEEPATVSNSWTPASPETEQGAAPADPHLASASFSTLEDHIASPLAVAEPEQIVAPQPQEAEPEYIALEPSQPQPDFGHQPLAPTSISSLQPSQPTTEESLPASRPAAQPNNEAYSWSEDPGRQVGAERERNSASADHRLPAGLPFAALERAFVFTTGEGRAIWESPTAARLFKEIIGEELSTFRGAVPRDLIFGCDAADLLGSEGRISESVWRAMAARQPLLLEKAKERLYRVCVRTFRIEADTIIVLVLFYNKQRL